MQRGSNLLEGNITRKMMALAMPLMGSSFLNMAYTVTDLFWVGQLSTKAVAAVGICGLYWWLATSLLMVSSVGLAVSVSQNFGRGDMKAVYAYVNAGVKLNALLGGIYTACVFLARKPLLAFFCIRDPGTYEAAFTYLGYICPALFLTFVVPILGSILNATGNSATTFRMTAIGVGLNMVLDPIFMLVLDWGVKGAAIATGLSLLIEFFLYLYVGKKAQYLYWTVDYRRSWERGRVSHIARLGIPPACQSAVHCGISMVLNRFVNDFGSAAVAAQSIGSQVESISWLTAEGFSTANATFLGQNYGAGKYARVDRAYYTSLRIVICIGIFAAGLLYAARYPIMSAFLHEPEALRLGALYLLILSVSQPFMTVEIATAGAFNALSMTKPPSIVGIAGNLLRIPLALWLMHLYGIAGIWIAVSGTSVAKGIVQVGWFLSAKRHALREVRA